MFDPIHTTEHSNLWHRGFKFPISFKKRFKKDRQRENKLFSTGRFWNGDPDIDAVCRITQMPEIEIQRL